MVARSLRVALFASLVLALWSFARPARAATLAPFCDDRGATALASPPALEATDEAVRRTAATPCDGSGDAPLFGVSLGSAPHRAPAAAAHVAPMRTAPAFEPLAPAPVEALEFVPASTLTPPGVRFRVERPPRD
jgi:hypothetical protein